MRPLGLRNKQQRSRLRLEQIGVPDRIRPGLLAAGCLLIMTILAGCRSGSERSAGQTRELIVFAAASLTEAFDEVAHQFEVRNPGVTVVLNLAGSQQLAHQLSQGAPADLFASADENQMAAVITTGRVSSGSQEHFAANKLTLIFPADNPAGLHTLSDLARPGLKLVLAAPAVPAGHYAGLMFDLAAADPGFGPIFKERVLGNVVSYEENVRAVLSKVRLGEADAGIVYKSDVTPALGAEVGQLPIPRQLNVAAAYVVAPLRDSENPGLAREFIDFLLGAQGQEILVAKGLEGAPGP
jgi:molybdate transport system substrate-binding protein